MPLGSDVDSVQRWEDFLVAQRPELGNVPWRRNKVLRDYLGAAKLAGPPLAAVQVALLAFHEAEARIEALRAREKAEADARRARIEAFRAREKAEADVRKAREKAEAEERRVSLRAELKKRGLKRSSDATSYDAFVKKGRTKQGLSTSTDVAESMALLGERQGILTAATSEVSDVDGFSDNETEKFIYTGLLGGQPATRKELVMELLCRKAKKKEAEMRAAENLSKLKAEREKVGARKARQAKARYCTTSGCNNLHRIHGPAVTASGPVCGACEKVLNLI